MKWIAEQIEWLKGFFSEDTDKGRKASSKRLAGLLTVCTLLFSYAKVAIQKQEVIAMPETNALLIAAIIGLTIWSNKQTGNSDK